jgi:hypothetical protein
MTNETDLYEIETETEVTCKDDVIVKMNIKIDNLPISEKFIDIFHDWLHDLCRDLTNTLGENLEETLNLLVWPKPKEVSDLIDPVEMLDNKYAGMSFQQYSHGKPEKWFYRNCGHSEKSVVCVWYDDERKTYSFSAEDDKASLVSLNPHVKCKLVDYDVIEMAVRFNNGTSDKGS